MKDTQLSIIINLHFIQHLIIYVNNICELSVNISMIMPDFMLNLTHKIRRIHGLGNQPAPSL